MRCDVGRTILISVAVGLALAGCGDDDSGDATGSSTPTESDGNATMSVAGLCDPVEDEVAAFAQAPTTPEHNTIYADSAEPLLDCKWVVDGVDRTIFVSYVGVPDSFFMNLVDGERDRADVVAPNFHDKSAFYVIAPNGWGIVVKNLGAVRSEDVDAMAVIANAAVAQLES